MSSCTIIISHYESLPFLRACVRQIQKFKHPDVDQYIFIADQSNDATHSIVMAEFGRKMGISVIRMSPLYSGYGIDYIMRNVEILTEYVCQIHVDAFPIHKNWLYMPIKLIEEFGLSFVGQLQFISKLSDTIYPPNKFFAMAQCFNVAKTSTYRLMSFEAGFTRFHNRDKSGMIYNNNDWAYWAQEDYPARGSDDDVVAFHWQDKYRLENKLGLAITGFIEPNYGRIIEDVVFHFGSCREALGVLDSMPKLYVEYLKRINEDYSDELIDEMVALAKKNSPDRTEILSRNFWDGIKKESTPPSEEINKRIEELK